MVIYQDSKPDKGVDLPERKRERLETMAGRVQYGIRLEQDIDSRKYDANWESTCPWLLQNASRDV